MTCYIYNMKPKLMYIEVAVQIKVVNVMCVTRQIRIEVIEV